MKNAIIALSLLAVVFKSAYGGERSVMSLKDFSEKELKEIGIDVPQSTAFHVKALGAGGDHGWTSKSDEMFAYAWIIDADSRKLIWKMTVDNTSSKRDDREFDGNVTLSRGSYEVYFGACTFTYHTAFKHITTNIDHRDNSLLEGKKKKDKDFFSIFKEWWSDDVAKAWQKRSRQWGIDMLVEESKAATIKTFTPPKEFRNVLFKAIGLGENELIRGGFSLAEPMTLHIYALGEAVSDREPADFGWIVNTADRSRVWELRGSRSVPAGGAKKNIKFAGDITFNKGNYVVYYISDDSHSSADWNDAPPDDPLNWGITLSATDEREKKKFKPYQYNEDQNVIVSITKVQNDETRTEGFTLKEDSKIRVYAFGERSNSRRILADYGFITDVKTRQKVWAMDVDQAYHAGGASKNCYVDEVITLPKGSYTVTYTTDDSHAYDGWNASPPFDPEHYGITLMGAGERFNTSIVSKYVEQRDKNVIAQIIRVRDNADKEERFKLDRTTKVRVYALGEGQDRQMFDYGWIEDAKGGNTVWEMTYSMTFHAGGGRKNRMVNTTILLDRGEYILHYVSDDSHSYSSWNVDPPEDQQYWGITLFRDEGHDLPPIPNPPEEPE
jgi:hypothetical protein